MDKYIPIIAVLAILVVVLLMLVIGKSKSSGKKRTNGFDDFEIDDNDYEDYEDDELDLDDEEVKPKVRSTKVITLEEDDNNEEELTEDHSDIPTKEKSVQKPKAKPKTKTTPKKKSEEKDTNNDNDTSKKNTSKKKVVTEVQKDSKPVQKKKLIVEDDDWDFEEEEVEVGTIPVKVEKSVEEMTLTSPLEETDTLSDLYVDEDDLDYLSDEVEETQEELETEEEPEEVTEDTDEDWDLSDTEEEIQEELTNEEISQQIEDTEEVEVEDTEEVEIEDTEEAEQITTIRNLNEIDLLYNKITNSFEQLKEINTIGTGQDSELVITSLEDKLPEPKFISDGEFLLSTTKVYVNGKLADWERMEVQFRKGDVIEISTGVSILPMSGIVFNVKGTPNSSNLNKLRIEERYLSQDECLEEIVVSAIATDRGYITKYKQYVVVELLPVA